MSPLALSTADAFDLPEWLGTGEITWTALSGLRTGHLVSGWLADQTGRQVPCDLLAVDEAYPQVVVADAQRVLAHRAWRHGQSELAFHDERLCVLLPGSRVEADSALEGISRLARAVGADPEHWSVTLRIGRESGVRSR